MAQVERSSFALSCASSGGDCVGAFKINVFNLRLGFCVIFVLAGFEEEVIASPGQGNGDVPLQPRNLLRISQISRREQNVVVGPERVLGLTRIPVSERVEFNPRSPRNLTGLRFNPNFGLHNKNLTICLFVSTRSVAPLVGRPAQNGS